MKDTKKQIKSVNDNKDKQFIYKSMMDKYKRAVANGFYFEALLIDYAMLEDRMRSFLYYIGAVRNSEALKLNVSKTKSILRRLYFGSIENASGKRLDLKNISCKEKLIRKTIEWVIESNGIPEEAYLAILKQEYEGCLDLQGLLDVLHEIDDWRNYRNEIIHGLMNKNLESLNEKLTDKIEDGMKYARFLDSQVKVLKKHNEIRRTMKIKD